MRTRRVAGEIVTPVAGVVVIDVAGLIRAAALDFAAPAPTMRHVSPLVVIIFLVSVSE